MNRTAPSSRRKTRYRVSARQILRLRVADGANQPRLVTADLLDYCEQGVGVALAVPLGIGVGVGLIGQLGAASGNGQGHREAKVVWCLEKADGTFRAGLQFTDGVSDARPPDGEAASPPPDLEPEDDYYETLQLNPKADPDTIHRVYRILAQRYHPDNTETGDAGMFRRVSDAYRVLREPEQRAAYDVRHCTRQRSRWRIFDQARASTGVEGEKRKRWGILSLLYHQRASEPDRPLLSLLDLEDLLGCPRDHLQMSLWYLKEKGLIHRTDNGRFSITAEGVDQVEEQRESKLPPVRLIADGAREQSPGAGD